MRFFEVLAWPWPQLHLHSLFSGFRLFPCSHTDLLPLVFFAIVGAIVRAFLRHRAGTYHDSGPRTIIVQEQPVAPVVYAEETVVIAPPAQQPYAPNTYVANPQGQQVVYTQSPYGAPAGNQQVIYSSGGVHETY